MRSKRLEAVLIGGNHLANVLVIHVNRVTRKIESGYLMEHGVKIGDHLTPSRIASIIAVTPVEFLSV